MSVTKYVKTVYMIYYLIFYMHIHISKEVMLSNYAHMNNADNNSAKITHLLKSNCIHYCQCVN